MTASPSSVRRLLTASTAVLAMLLLMLGTVLMHSVIGHDMSADMDASTSMVAMSGPANTNASHATSATHGNIPILTAAGVSHDADGLMCSLMGMACVVVIALFAWAMLGPRVGGVLHLLSRLVALAAQHARRVAVPRPPSLTALQIIRI